MPRSPSRNSPTPSPVPTIRLEAKVDSPEASKGRRAMAMARDRRMPARRQRPPLVPMLFYVSGMFIMIMVILSLTDSIEYG